MAAIDDLADQYVEDWAALSPIDATMMGVPGHDAELDDLSPEGYAARADLNRRTLAALGTLVPESEPQRVSQAAMQERLGLWLERYDAGEITSEVNVITSAMHEARVTFDLTPTEGEEAVANITARLGRIPAAIEEYKRTLLAAADAGHVSASAQMLEVAKQFDIWADPDGDDFYRTFASGLTASGPLRTQLDGAAEAATAATRELARFLRDELAPRGRSNQAAGRERYALASRFYLGATIDLDETYAWGFEELHRIENEMRAVSAQITGSDGASIDDGVAALDADPTRKIAGRDAFRDWMQELTDETIADMHDTHFDIPEPVRRMECCIAPTSDGGIYYSGPSEDFSRPGRMWWAVPAGIDEFSTWREVTTVYHEGVPGHHLQIAQSQVRADTLTRWQRLMGFCSGHGEGWALYSERLMDDLGYLDDPGNKLGMLDAQAFRAARVVVDIGMHLELEIPADNPFGFHPGERWTPELGWEFMRAHCRIPDEQLRFEVNRYLGWPGQAPAYKVGERIWLQARADAEASQGSSFDLKAFHRAALDLGSLGLDPFREALARL